MGANRSNTDLTNPSATPRKPRSIDTYVYICIHRAFYTLASSTSTWVISFLALGYIKYSVSFINKKDPTWNCFSARTFFRFSFFSLAIILSPHRPFSLVSDGKWWENKRRPLLTAPVRTRRKPRKKICGPFSFHGRHNWGDGIFFQPKKRGIRIKSGWFHFYSWADGRTFAPRGAVDAELRAAAQSCLFNLDCLRLGYTTCSTWKSSRTRMSDKNPFLFSSLFFFWFLLISFPITGQVCAIFLPSFHVVDMSRSIAVSLSDPSKDRRGKRNLTGTYATNCRTV